MLSKLNNINEVIKPSIDIFSITTLAASLTGLITPIAALLTLIWSAIRIYETETVQKVLKRKKNDTSK